MIWYDVKRSSSGFALSSGSRGTYGMAMVVAVGDSCCLLDSEKRRLLGELFVDQKSMLLVNRERLLLVDKRMCY